jgi:hypothetical protein
MSCERFETMQPIQLSLQRIADALEKIAKVVADKQPGHYPYIRIGKLSPRRKGGQNERKTA